MPASPDLSGTESRRLLFRDSFGRKQEATGEENDAWDGDPSPHDTYPSPNRMQVPDKSLIGSYALIHRLRAVPEPWRMPEEFQSGQHLAPLGSDEWSHPAGEVLIGLRVRQD